MHTPIKVRTAFFIVALYILLPLSGYTGIVENIKSTCPSDPTQNGRCALVEVIEDGPSCRDIGGEQVCRDWWKKEYHYKCAGSFDPDTILMRVGNQFCAYTRQCTQWTDLEKTGGITSCRIYIDLNRPGCDGGTAIYSCVANDCGDLFDRCSMKQYVNYGTIQDRGNLADDINCDPASGTCSEEILEGSLSGTKLGVYTFQCPAEIKKICTSYTDTLTCPDGQTQLCNRSKVCKQQGTTTANVKAQKSCSADRQFQSYSVLKDSLDDIAMDDNPMCIKLGEIGTCDPVGCTNAGHGIRYWVRNGGTMATLDGMNAWDWGSVEISGLGNNTIKVHGFATGLDGQCAEGFDTIIQTSTPHGTLLGYVYPHWEGSCQTIPVYYNGYTCSDGSCVHKIVFSGMGAPTVYVPVTRIESQYNCFSDFLINECTYQSDPRCVQLSDTGNLNSLECLTYEIDMNMIDTLCKRYVIQYECAEEKTTTNCTEYEDVLVCGNVVYPIPNVTATGADFTNDFGPAMAMAQAANELKHVWTGKNKLCESGSWWLFDSMSLGDYIKSKLMTYALSYVGGELFSKVSTVLSDSTGCITNDALASAKIAAMYGTGAGGENLFGHTQSISDCFSNAAFSSLSTLGLSDAQALKFMNFMGDPITMAAIQIAVEIISSIDNCSTCSEEECAKDHNQYEPYALISNRLCHFVDSDCTWKLALNKCLRTGYKYCCYDSLFARILVEQAYIQKGYSWGSYDSPNCTQLTFEDLKTLNFDSMDFTEFISTLEAKMKGVLNEEEYKQKIRDSMTLPD
jgi:hypothetical protein